MRADSPACPVPALLGAARVYVLSRLMGDPEKTAIAEYDKLTAGLSTKQCASSQFGKQKTLPQIPRRARARAAAVLSHRVAGAREEVEPAQSGMQNVNVAESSGEPASPSLIVKVTVQMPGMKRLRSETSYLPDPSGTTCGMIDAPWP